MNKQSRDTSSVLLLLGYKEERCEIHNTLNTAPRIPPTGLMVIPSCSSGNGGLTNILSLTSQKINHHCSLNTLPLHVIYLFSHHRSKRRLRRTDCLVSVGANRLADLHIYGVRFRPKDPAALNHLIISDHSVWFIMVCMLSDSHTNHHFHQIISSWFACLLVYTQRGASKSSVQVIKTLSDHSHEDLFQIFVSNFKILFLIIWA